MWLMDKWRQYAGTPDERIVADSCKGYRIGYIALSIGYIAALYFDISWTQVASVHDVYEYANPGFSTSAPGIFFLLWFIVTDVALIVRQNRRGYVDESRFAETDRFPAGYFALISGMCGIAVMLVTALFRLIAELVLVGPAHTYWLGNIAVGLFFGIVVFGLCYLAFYCSFRSAKKHREAIAASFLED